MKVENDSIRPIINLVEPSTVIAHRCTVCHRNVKVKELQLGSNGQAQCTFLCKQCLSILGDIIWESDL
jgi:hypothetical protein